MKLRLNPVRVLEINVTPTNVTDGDGSFSCRARR